MLADERWTPGNPLQVRWISKPEMQQFLNRLKEPAALKAAETEQPDVLEGTSDAAQPGPAFKTGISLEPVKGIFVQRVEV